VRELIDLVERDPAPRPWSEDSKIPWDDPAFSRRMLAEHLSQEHDRASRRRTRVEQHVRWINDELLSDSPSRVLDLGCGPGLYSAALARLGHTCVGIDFGPAPIEYATDASTGTGDGNTYILGDIRSTPFGRDYDLVMLIFGELNVFRRADARDILDRARVALRDGGRLVLEVHTEAAVRAMGAAPATWRTRERGLFSDTPYLLLEESFWDGDEAVAIRRHYVVDCRTAAVSRYGQCVQAYTTLEYRNLLVNAGFSATTIVPSLSGQDDDPDFVVLLARA
jgi:SAM-dependent methyltransferase